MYSNILFCMDRAEKAVSVLQSAESRAGLAEKENVYFALGNVLGKLCHYQDAVRYFERAVKVNPAASVYANYALTFAARGIMREQFP
jgi:tetratricopeptide (TPR) repeat protein